MNYELWTDISHYQNGAAPGGPIDFARMKQAGAAGVCIRKSSGFYRDTWFERNWEAAGAAGLKRTFYAVPFVGYDFDRQWAAMTTRADGSPFDPSEVDRAPWCDVEYRHPLAVSTAIGLLLEWMHAMTEWGGKPNIYSAKYVWQDYYSKAKGWGEDWPLVAANYREGWYGLPVTEMIAKAVAAGDPLTPLGWEYTKQGVMVPIRDRWTGWQFAADRNLLGATFGVKSRDIDLSIQRVADEPEPPVPPTPEPPPDIAAWLKELRAAHATVGHVIAEFPG